MVYFEQPVGVGFSYSSNPADYQTLNDAVAASDNSAFLTAFFAAHPQYASLPLFLTSESYGGNYVPQMTRAVLEGTDTRLQAQLMKGGFAVGNPVFSIDDTNATFANIMNAVQAEIFYGHSLIPLAFLEKFNRAGCAALNPPSSPCDDLNNEMIALAGACFGGNDCGHVRLALWQRDTRRRDRAHERRERGVDQVPQHAERAGGHPREDAARALG